MVLVDTNVLLDILTNDPEWFEWSRSALLKLVDEPLAINPIIYAELAPAYLDEKTLKDDLSAWEFHWLNLPYAAGFLAGRAFVQYRKTGGAKVAPLPDFYIGAHALVENMRLLTRDAGRYRSYFPKLKLITP